MPAKGTGTRTRAVNCAVCGRAFEAQLHDVERGYGKYCSRACYGDAIRLRREVACPVCCRAFAPKLADVRRGGGKYCSPACYHAAMSVPRGTIASRFWPKVEKTEGCWLWTGARQRRNGSLRYGTFEVDGRAELAHRVAWQLASGRWPRLHVCHTCDEPGCVRNDDLGTYELHGVVYRRRGHLFLAAQHENNRDAIAKGRAYRKLSDAQVLEIAARLADGEPVGMLAAEYGVHHSHISDIKRGRRHGRLTGL